MKKDVSPLGLEIRKQLTLLGKKQKWLAKECNVSEEYISRIILGKTKPSPEITDKMAKLFKVKVKDLRRMLIAS